MAQLSNYDEAVLKSQPPALPGQGKHDGGRGWLWFLAGIGAGVIVSCGLMIAAVAVVFALASEIGFDGLDSDASEVGIEVLKYEPQNGQLWAQIRNPSEFEVFTVFGSVELVDESGRLQRSHEFYLDIAPMAPGALDQILISTYDDLTGEDVEFDQRYKLAFVRGYTY